jgi:hypothetical protein
LHLQFLRPAQHRQRATYAHAHVSQHTV